MAVSIDQFGKSLVASGLLTAEEVKALWNGIPAESRPKDGETFSSLLVKQERLNAFQAQELLSGSGTPLVLGDYVLLAKIGAGGMGQVFRAEHRHMKRLAAIKLLPASMTKDEGAVKRFQREVQAAAKLSHPNIVQTHDAGVQKGVWYLVMEYVEGRDLSAIVAERGPLSITESVDCVLQAARGLAFAHTEGVVHRDIKPANLLLDKKGVVKILDMGLARFDTSADAADNQLTGAGQVMGTVDYMAPEQAASTHDADGRSDVYSLGCTLYRLLTGDNVYQGETVVKRLFAHLNDPIPLISTKRAEVPAELDRIFQKMVAKKPEDRYQQASQLIAELEAWRNPGATTSFVGSAPAVQDSRLTDSFRSVGAASDPKVTGHSLELKTPTPAAPEQTVAYAGPEIATDPRSEIVSAPVKKQGSVDRGTGRKPPSAKLVAAGAAGFLLLCLGVWVIIRDKDGNEVARMKVPEGGTATVQTPTPPKAISTPKSTVPPTAAPSPPTKSPTVAASSTPTGPTPSLAVAPFDAAQAKAHQQAWAKHLGIKVETPNSVGQTMILIPPGEFLMGSTDDQVEAALKAADEIKAELTIKDRIQKNERPLHKVIIAKPLLMSATEVSVGQFKKFAAATGYQTEAENAAQDAKSGTYLAAASDYLPAAYITWNDATAYCQWLSTQEKATYRLPTEAEWEYACRAGTTTQYSFGDDVALLDQYGWYLKIVAGKSHPVGTKLPNPFGLFDMHGSLYEWCSDYYDEKWYSASTLNAPNGPSVGSARVTRGGSWTTYAYYCRSAARYNPPPSHRALSSGFRCVSVLELPTTTANITSQLAAAVTTPGKLFIHDPAFQQWMKDVAAMPAEKQVEAVMKKLQELNPGFAGSKTEKIEFGVVTELRFATNYVTDISPVRALVGLKVLACAEDVYDRGGKLAFSDLSPLRGMPLTKLDCSYTGITELSPLRGMPLTELKCTSVKLSDLSPLRGMRLIKLDCSYTQLSDLSLLEGMPLMELSCNGTLVSSLSPLQGMKLKSLNCVGTRVTDLSSLQGMLLAYLNCSLTQVSDLSPLQGMPLTILSCDRTQVSDLSPLQGMPLTNLYCPGTQVSDLSPLEKCLSLKTLNVTQTKVAAAGVAALQKALPNCKITWDDPAKPATLPPSTPVIPVNTFKEPAFQQWMKDVAALPAEKQVEEVAKKLQELNSGFDGKVTAADGKGTPKIENGVVTELAFLADNVTDLSPVRALVGLKALRFSGNGKSRLSDLSPLHRMQLESLACFHLNISDLSPLEGMPLTNLDCSGTEISDLTPLQGMKLKSLNCVATRVTDLSSLQGMPLTNLDCSITQISDLSPLRGMPLTRLACAGTRVTDLSSLQGMPLAYLSCNSTQVSDLSFLQGMPLTYLYCNRTEVADLTPLEKCNGLKTLDVTQTKVTPASVTALQKALPDCQIEWDDPAKAKTPVPAASGTK